jgi:glycosyltransferase involved in cell wall biosynthesis
VKQAADITVVIPTHNREPLLPRSLGSALGQVGVSVEVIVVDDGSTDATSAILGAQRDPRVRVITHARSLGVTAARNAGVARARSGWIALLDDDDLWAPDKLRVQLDAVRATGAEFAYCAAVHLGPDLQVLRIEPAPEPESLASLLLSVNALPAGSSNVLVARRLLTELGGFDESLFHLADWDLWLRLAQSATGVACEDALVGYVKHPQNMLGLRPRGFFGELERFAVKHRDATGASGLEFDRVEVARWVAVTHRRAGRRIDAAAAYLRAARFGDCRRSVGSLLRTISERHPYVGRWPVGSLDEPAWLESLRGSRPLPF